MNTLTRIRPILISGLTLTLAQLPVVADNPPLLASLVISQPTILPFEPIGASITIRNQSVAQQEVSGIGRTNVGGIMIRSEAGAIWEGYGRPGNLNSPPLNVSPVTLKAGESRHGFVCVSTNYLGEGALGIPGTYWLKALVGRLYSDPVKLQVREPPLVDKVAYEHLKDSRLYQCFDPETALVGFTSAISVNGRGNTNEKLQQLRAFTEKFPNSRYSEWAKLGLLYLKEVPLLRKMWANRGLSPQDTAEMRHVRNEMREKAPHFPAPLNALCWYEAGVLSVHLDDFDSAKSDFSKARAARADNSMEERIAFFYENLERNPIKIVTPKGPILSPEEKAIKELESQGYDVNNFWQKYPIATKEYNKAAATLDSQLNNLKISREEYERQISDLLKRTVKKYSSPISRSH